METRRDNLPDDFLDDEVVPNSPERQNVARRVSIEDDPSAERAAQQPQPLVPVAQPMNFGGFFGAANPLIGIGGAPFFQASLPYGSIAHPYAPTLNTAQWAIQQNQLQQVPQRNLLGRIDLQRGLEALGNQNVEKLGPNGATIAAATLYSKEYNQETTRMVTLFLTCIENVPQLAPLVEESPHSHLPDEAPRPHIFNILALSNTNDLRVRELLNKILISMATRMQFEDGAIYQPGTQSRKFWTFFSFLNKQGIPWKLSMFKGFDGSLDNVSKTIFANEAKADPNYGNKKNRMAFEEEDAFTMRTFANSPGFVCADWLEHLVQLGFGTQLGLRGRDEHRLFMWAFIEFGEYPFSSPLYGNSFVKITLKLLTKNNMISLGTFTKATRQ